MTESIDLDAYFARIGYAGPRDASLKTLSALCERHPKAIPFENLGPLTGQVPALDTASLQAKLVAGGRGGYCFEHNGLFAAVLTALGFELRLLAARAQWAMAPDAPMRPRTHMLMMVTTEAGDRLVDVGFGGLVLTAPLLLEPGAVQDTGHGVFRIEPVGDDLQLQFQIPGPEPVWAPMCLFSLEAQHAIDYEMANWFIATHAKSPFHTQLICSAVFDDRRIGLWNGELAVRYRDGPVEKRSLDADGLTRALIEDFGLPEAVVLAARPALERVAVLPPQ